VVTPGGHVLGTHAKVDDGQFEVIIGDLFQISNRLSAHKLYDGAFLTCRDHHFRGKSILIESLDDVYLELDGEQPRRAYGCTVIPQALTLAVEAKNPA